jgi:hypothetical protein
MPCKPWRCVSASIIVLSRLDNSLDLHPLRPPRETGCLDRAPDHLAAASCGPLDRPLERVSPRCLIYTGATVRRCGVLRGCCGEPWADRGGGHADPPDRAVAGRIGMQITKNA